MSSNERHFLHYLILAVGLSLIFLLFFLFRYDVVIRLWLVVAGSAFYTFWGIIHHALEKRLTKVIALEYILFGLFAFLLLLTALNL
jgi:hypothetical protein